MAVCFFNVLVLLLVAGTTCSEARGEEGRGGNVLYDVGLSLEKGKREGVGAPEVFGFMLDPITSPSLLSRLTTIGWQTDPEVLRAAHAMGVKVVSNAELTGATAKIAFGSEEGRELFVSKLLSRVQASGSDGVNFDFEGPIPFGGKDAALYTEIVNATRRKLRNDNAAAQISVDVPWSPLGIDGRWYDWNGLSEVSDFFFVMAYDTRSQVWDACIAGPNSALDLIEHGLQDWLNLGIPSEKLVLGLPWYGYDYPCEELQGQFCKIQKVPFAGAPCSDAAGAQVPYSQVVDILHRNLNITTPSFDDGSASMFFEYFPDKKTGDAPRQVHQVWYDTEVSLAKKYNLAHSLGLRGIGFWNVDCLVYEKHEPQTDAMLRAIDAFVSNKTAKA